MRLRGEAKSFDVHCIIFESKRLVSKWAECSDYMESRFAEMFHHISQRSGHIEAYIHRELQKHSKHSMVSQLSLIPSEVSSPARRRGASQMRTASKMGLDRPVTAPNDNPLKTPRLLTDCADDSSQIR